MKEEEEMVVKEQREVEVEEEVEDEVVATGRASTCYRR